MDDYMISLYPVDHLHGYPFQFAFTADDARHAMEQFMDDQELLDPSIKTWAVEIRKIEWQTSDKKGEEECA